MSVADFPKSKNQYLIDTVIQTRAPNLYSSGPLHPQPAALYSPVQAGQ